MKVREFFDRVMKVTGDYSLESYLKELGYVNVNSTEWVEKNEEIDGSKIILCKELDYD